MSISFQKNARAAARDGNAQRTHSAGFVVFRRARGKTLFLLMYSTHGFWGFPKGEAEKGERAIDIAVRELKEETGINRFFVVSGFRTQYGYAHGGGKKTERETVTLYLAKTDMAAIILSQEHTAFRWASYEEAKSAITFLNAQRSFARAYRFYRHAQKTIALQEKVYSETQRIPKGRVAAYADIARRCGITPRAAGKMLANNYDVRVPCHRVVASSGMIFGYNRGIEHKIRALKKEGIAIRTTHDVSRVADMRRYFYTM